MMRRTVLKVLSAAVIGTTTSGDSGYGDYTECLVVNLDADVNPEFHGDVARYEVSVNGVLGSESSVQSR